MGCELWHLWVECRSGVSWEHAHCLSAWWQHMPSILLQRLLHQVAVQLVIPNIGSWGMQVWETASTHSVHWLWVLCIIHHYPIICCHWPWTVFCYCRRSFGVLLLAAGSSRVFTYCRWCYVSLCLCLSMAMLNQLKLLLKDAGCDMRQGIALVECCQEGILSPPSGNWSGSSASEGKQHNSQDRVSNCFMRVSACFSGFVSLGFSSFFKKYILLLIFFEI